MTWQAPPRWRSRQHRPDQLWVRPRTPVIYSRSDINFKESIFFSYLNRLFAQPVESVHVHERLPLVILVAEADEAENPAAALAVDWK